MKMLQSSIFFNLKISFLGVSFSSQVSFHGDGWLELDKDLLPHKSTQEDEVISIRFTTNDTNSLVLWHGQPPNHDGLNQDYLSLSSMPKSYFCVICNALHNITLQK